MINDDLYSSIIRDCFDGYNSLELSLKYNIEHEAMKAILESIFLTCDFKVEEKNGKYCVLYR